ncbi:MAG: ABC transporter permease [Bryobacteraceae bacterium]|nr:ABC transporter permease [Bryobacteraceae bacterium]MDW8380214.1 ABC transporter permease [Bryobacterales bacterium]
MRIDPVENIKLALDAVWSHRVRSALTILGIVIGITTVVTVSSLLTGLRKGIVIFFQEFGPDNIFVSRYSGDPSAPPRQKEVRRRPIRPEYAEIIKKLSPSTEDVGVQLFIPPFVNRQPMVARVPGFESDRVNLASCTANQLSFAPRELSAGRVFTPEEDSRMARVGLIGASLAEALFPDGKALGKQVTVDGAEYTVIGVFAPAKGGFFGENGLDYQFLIPFQTARMRYPQLDNFFLTVKAKAGLRDQAYDEVQTILRKIRRVPPGAENDFAISTADQIIRSFDQLTGVVLLVSTALSGLGLLVGGIGVMNIMLVSVTERTREIGVRKAIGARRVDIVLQFLVEAVTLTGVGGLIGIVFSIIVTMLVGALVPALPSEVPPWAVVAGFLVSVSVGLFFGVWPAMKAARLDPVEALRYE